MNGVLLFLAWVTPLVVALSVSGSLGRWWLPAAALPALAAALFVPVGTTFEIPWLLLGVQLGLDSTARVFLTFSAVLWLAAALYASASMHADPKWVRFRVCFLLAMGGNFGLIVGQDLVSFYLSFALMGLAAYGLVNHDGSASARRAGRVYLVMTIIGEVALFAGFVLLYARTGTLVPGAAQIGSGAGAMELTMLVLAFGIKAGLIGMHFWLPLAHPAAPVAASAVLSGAMIKAALIGWMRYLPLGQYAMPELGLLLAAVGIAGALLAVLLGLGQRDPKVVLAYSSIGKMGTMIAGLGVAAARPEIATAVVAALTFYSAHHGLAKGALFLGVGVVKSSSQRWPLVLLVLPALVLAGLPWTSGALAKSLFEASLVDAPALWGALFAWALPATAAGTVLLLSRFLYLASRVAGSKPSQNTRSALPWMALVVTSLALPLIHESPVAARTTIWPILAAFVLALVVWAASPRALTRWIGRVPPGDVVEPLRSVLARLRDVPFGLAAKAIAHRFAQLCNRATRRFEAVRRRTEGAENALRNAAIAGPVWLGATALALLTLVRW